MKLLILCTFWGIVAYGAKMEITLFANLDKTGQSITLDESCTGMEAVIDIVGLGQGIKYLCLIGAWQIKSNATNTLPPSSARDCRELRPDFQRVTEISRVGPPDTSTIAISFNTNPVTVVEDEHGQLTFTPDVLKIYKAYSSGKSNWTFFEGQNFTGNKSCKNATEEVNLYHLNDVGLASVGSVRRGCTV